MPTLDWIGKKAVLNHHREVPFHLLKEVPELSVGDPDAGNLLVQGDNLLALKALLPQYAGKVKCIYIDPPYNTGMDERGEDGQRGGWVYDDNLQSPETVEWLHRVVGAEAEDLSRHDKWLCMMYPRVRLLKEFLREDGVIFVSIDNTELASLTLLLDEVFGIRNRVGTIVWENATDNNPTRIATEHEYVLCYARAIEKSEREWKSVNLGSKARLIEEGDRYIEKYSSPEERQLAYTRWFREHKNELWPFQDYKFIDAGGVYTGMRAVHNPGREGYRYDVLHPTTGLACAQPLMGYRFPEATMRDLVAQGRILFGEDETKLVELKVYAKDYRAKLASVFELDGRVGTNELKAIFPESRRPFDFPKPTELVMELISFVTRDGDIVLDAFAGSGTTGHAVLRLNALDGLNRHFVLVERKESIAKEITAERLKRVILGGNGEAGAPVLGGGVAYCVVGEPLLEENGALTSGMSFDELAAVIVFAEGGRAGAHRGDGMLVGIVDDRAVCLLARNGIPLPLTSGVLDELPPFEGVRVVYGAVSRVSEERLKAARVVFRQIPYQLGLFE